MRIAANALIVLESFVVALLFRFDAQVPEEFWIRFWPFALVSVMVFVVLLQRLGLVSAVLLAAGILVIANAGIDFIRSRPVPLSVILTGAVFTLVQLLVVRRVNPPWWRTSTYDAER
jgi:hypothetical protein